MESFSLEKIFGSSETSNYFGPWVIQLFIIIFLILLINFIFKRVLKRLEKRAEKTSSPWDDAFIKSVSKPFRLLVWIVGILFAAEIVADRTEAEIFEIIDPLRHVFVIVTLAWFLIRFTKAFEKAYLIQQRNKSDDFDVTTTHAITKLVRASIFITAGLVMMQTLGFSISGILAFGGISGFAVGYAAKDLLSNFFGGLMIYLDRPFRVGDWILSPDRAIEGTVEKVGWRQTQIRSFSKRPIYVPNSIFMNIIVENPSRMSHRRINEVIGIRYQDIHAMDKIVEEVKQMLIDDDEIDTTQTLIVNFDVFNDSSVDFFIYTFTKTTDWIKYHQVKHNVLLKVYSIIENNDADIAFPTRVVQLEKSSEVIESV